MPSSAAKLSTVRQEVVPHADDPPSPGLGAVDDIRRLLADLAELRVHLVVLDVLRLHRAEGAQAHMEGDRGKDHAFFPDALHQLRGKVEPGRGGGSGTRFPAIDRLVPVRVGKVLFDVVGQGHFPQLLQNLQEDALIVERDDPVARFQHLVDGGSEPAVAKGDVGPFFQPAAGIDDALPPALSQVFQQQHFHGAAGAGFFAHRAGPGMTLVSLITRQSPSWR